MSDFQKFTFVFKDIVPGRMGQCPVRIRHEKNRVMVILTEPQTTGSVSVTQGFELIANQVYNHFLRETDPENVQWVQHSMDEASGEENYQRVALGWDGQRFSVPRWQGLFNAKAFLAAFAADSG